MLSVIYFSSSSAPLSTISVTHNLSVSSNKPISIFWMSRTSFAEVFWRKIIRFCPTVKMHFIMHFCLGFLSGVGSAEILAFHMFLFVSLRDKDLAFTIILSTFNSIWWEDSFGKRKGCYITNGSSVNWGSCIFGISFGIDALLYKNHYIFIDLFTLKVLNMPLS